MCLLNFNCYCLSTIQNLKCWCNSKFEKQSCFKINYYSFINTRRYIKYTVKIHQNHHNAFKVGNVINLYSLKIQLHYLTQKQFYCKSRNHESLHVFVVCGSIDAPTVSPCPLEIVRFSI